MPFGAPGQVRLAAKYGQHLYVVEGELDALSMIAAGRFAVAAPGASKWPSAWCEGWEALSRIIVLADGDDAGEGLAQRVAGTAIENFGTEWVKENLETFAFPDGYDANDLCRIDRLHATIAALERSRGWTVGELQRPGEYRL